MNPSTVAPSPTPTITVTTTPTSTSTQPTIIEEQSTIIQRQLSAGWYFGSKDNKLPGTPDSWIYVEAGRSSCWHKPGVECVTGATTYTCPSNGWVDCMPVLDEAKKIACSTEAMAWYKANCPEFQGAAL
ncbi:MAG TPA: hypothetical protein VLH94_02550 [Spirochaetia bacterium]|nr:hypothetical protein [Spirochaetia bacterium]